MTVKELLEQLQKAIADDPEVEEYNISFLDYMGRDNMVRKADMSKKYEELILE